MAVMGLLQGLMQAKAFSDSLSGGQNPLDQAPKIGNMGTINLGAGKGLLETLFTKPAEGEEDPMQKLLKSLGGL
jgi:hypothetical protein